MTNISKTTLAQRQALPLPAKVILAEQRIREWYNHWDGQVHVSFSGGKDSTVLLHLVRKLYPGVPAVFCDTGLEYPEVRDFVKSIPNVVWLRPTLTFKQVLEKYGYPVVSKKAAHMLRSLQNPCVNNSTTRSLYMTGIKGDGTCAPRFMLAKKWHSLIDSGFKISDRCCDIFKKYPLYKYQRETGLKPYVGTMAEDSEQRKFAYLQSGCNSFNSKRPTSKPLSIWTTADVWEYVGTNNLGYSSVYDTGVKNTGCMFCMFGVHLEKEPNRFQRMKQSHPKQYEYCMKDLGLDAVLDFMGVPH